MKPRYLTHIAATVAAFSLASAACAQYVWLDEKGVKQFSDQPPPVSVPQSRILKEPPARAATPSPSAAAGNADKGAPAPAEGGAESAKGKAPMSTAEKNADYIKRKNEQAEKEKKVAEETQRRTDKAKNCERAQEYSRNLASGVRIVRTDQNGERSFLTDEQRAQDTREAKRILDECK